MYNKNLKARSKLGKLHWWYSERVLTKHWGRVRLDLRLAIWSTTRRHAIKPFDTSKIKRTRRRPICSDTKCRCERRSALEFSLLHPNPGDSLRWARAGRPKIKGRIILRVSPHYTFHTWHVLVDCKGSPTAPARTSQCVQWKHPPRWVRCARLQNETLMLLLHFIIRLVIALACFATQFSERRAVCRLFSLLPLAMFAEFEWWLVTCAIEEHTRFMFTPNHQ